MARIGRLACVLRIVIAFRPSARRTASRARCVSARSSACGVRLHAAPQDDDPELFGGYTAKQRLREEIDSPFRKVRLVFFGASTGSALLALYFSVLNAAKGFTNF